MNERPYCTKENPMPPGTPPGIYYHNDSKVVSEDYYGLSGGGDYEKYECPHCGFRFRVELPD